MLRNVAYNTNTITSKIEELDNGIIINKLITKSGFKEAYVFEQNIEIRERCKLKQKPLLVDLSVIDPSIESINNMIVKDHFKHVQSIAVLIKSNFKKTLLRVWYKLKKKNDLPVEFFVKKENAFKCLESEAA